MYFLKTQPEMLFDYTNRNTEIKKNGVQLSLIRALSEF